MKEIRTNINLWINEVEVKWRMLPLQKQYKYIMICFAAYLIISIGGILSSLY
ncbi:hypothetical protein [Flavobacterium algicola]|uniref:hypothetical protein n=1 Tax=Flavobacterium algicola TaxID=556529 RepID=UPI001EFD40C1|nr:hypothetical protein [Flavobacterium algicola]MCG9793787.1 hypothetical protein [Flavobacterium algicola]